MTRWSVSFALLFVGIVRVESIAQAQGLPAIAIVPNAANDYQLPQRYSISGCAALPDGVSARPDNASALQLSDLPSPGAPREFALELKAGANAPCVVRAVRFLARELGGDTTVRASWDPQRPTALDLRVDSQALASSPELRRTLSLVVPRLLRREEALAADPGWLPCASDVACTYRMLLTPTEMAALIGGADGAFQVALRGEAAQLTPEWVLVRNGQAADRSPIAVARWRAIERIPSGVTSVPTGGTTARLTAPWVPLLVPAQAACLVDGSPPAVPCAATVEGDTTIAIETPTSASIGVQVTIPVRADFASGATATIWIDVNADQVPDWSVLGARTGTGQIRVEALPRGYKFCINQQQQPSRDFAVAPGRPEDVVVEVTPPGANDCSRARRARLRLYAGVPTARLGRDDVALEWDPAVPRRLMVHVAGWTQSDASARAAVTLSIADTDSSGSWIDGCTNQGCDFALDGSAAWHSVLRPDLVVAVVGYRGESLYAANGAQSPVQGRYAIESVARWRAARSSQVIPPRVYGLNDRVDVHSPALRFLPSECSLPCIIGGAAEQNCVRYVRGSSPTQGEFVLGQAAVAQLRTAGAELQISLVSDIVDSTHVPAFYLRPQDCRYEFLQVTPALADSRDGSIWFLARAGQEECLSAPIRSELPSGSAGITFSQAPSWQELAPIAARGNVAGSERLLIVPAEIAAGTTGRIAVRWTSNGHPVLRRDGNESSTLIEVDDAVNAAAVRVDVDLGGQILHDESRLAVDRQNQLLVPPTHGVPWSVALVNAATHERCRVGDVATVGSATLVDVGPNELSHVTSADRTTAYCVRGRANAESIVLGLALRANLGQVSLIRDLPEAYRGLAVYAGMQRLTLPTPTRTFFLPWPLRDSARVVCGDRDAHGMRPEQAPRALTRSQFRNCRVEIEVPSSLPAGSCDLASVISTSSPQELRLSIRHGAAAAAKTETVADVHVRGSIVPGLSVVRESCRDGHATIEWNVGDLLIGRDDQIEDYEEVAFELRHLPAAERTGELQDAYVPPIATGEADRSLTVRTVLMPRQSPAWVFGDYVGRENLGIRMYASLHAGFSLYRSPHSGYGVATSRDYDRTETVTVNYGVVGVIEPWNFSRNDPLVALFNPQIHLGLLFPTTFDRAAWWHSFSIVVGFGVRLPASTRPGAAAIPAQVAPTLWLEFARGARELQVAWLLGFNVLVGALGG